MKFAVATVTALVAVAARGADAAAAASHPATRDVATISLSQASDGSYNAMAWGRVDNWFAEDEVPVGVCTGQLDEVTAQDCALTQCGNPDVCIVASTWVRDSGADSCAAFAGNDYGVTFVEEAGPTTSTVVQADALAACKTENEGATTTSCVAIASFCY